MACLLLAVAGAPPARAEPPVDEATPMYTRDAVAVIDLTLPQPSIDALAIDHEEYRPGTFSLAFTDGSPDGAGTATEPMEIGIRLKGGASFRGLDRKAAFKLKLNYVKGKKFLGLKKMTLNNMVQDPSMIRETLSYEVFRAAEVPAPRTGYAFVRLNGEDLGVYLNVETFDDVSLERWLGPFDDPQHLYEGEYGADVEPGGAGAFEVDEGDEGNLADLEALIAAVAAEGPFTQRMVGLADLEEMTRMWAVEKYIGHWDGYAGLQGTAFPNNYYLYSSPVGEFQMLPWGTDLTWYERFDFGGAAGLLFTQCLADADCNALYRSALAEVAEAVYALDLDATAWKTAQLLRPWQELAAPREEHGPATIRAGVDEVREFIADRPKELADWLTGNSTRHSHHHASHKGHGAPPERKMRIERIAIAAGTLTTRLTVPAEGQAFQRVEIRTVDGLLPVCSTRAGVPEAGLVTLRCPLAATIQRRRRARWLKLNVRTKFTPVDGPSESNLRRVLATSIAPK